MTDWGYDFEDYDRDLERDQASARARDRAAALARVRHERAKLERVPVQAGPPKPTRSHDSHVRAAVARVVNAAIVSRGRTAVARHLRMKRSELVFALQTRAPGLRERVRVNGLPK